jgi:hypothetical protein
MPTTFASYNGTMTFSASPTTFVFTHYPTHTHLGSSSSLASSAKPSQSAPFPDDTIGKYGKLHISGASTCATPTFFFLVQLCPLLFGFLLFVC